MITCCVSGEAAKFSVDTSDAGPGAMVVTIDGPSKVQVNCLEVSDEYQFLYCPTAPGTYTIAIKYAGSTHIPFSPFKAHIEGKYRYYIILKFNSSHRTSTHHLVISRNLFATVFSLI